MTAGFPRALASFREHAAKVLGTSVDNLQGGPTDETTAGLMKEKVGDVWAFAMHRKDDPPKQARGWAVADGTVVTPDQNLGLLLDAAGAFGATPTLDAQKLAERIVWGMGMNHRVFIDPKRKADAPALTVGADGAGELTFVVGYREAGPGGSGGGPEHHLQCKVVLGADRTARLEKTPVQL